MNEIEIDRGEGRKDKIIKRGKEREREKKLKQVTQAFCYKWTSLHFETLSELQESFERVSREPDTSIDIDLMSF